MDWCLFHVEPDFADCWAGFHHALKQRNRLLKTRRDLHLLDYWDRYLCEPSLRIHRMRGRYVDELSQLIATELVDLLDGVPIELDYARGWARDKTLDEALQHDRDRDRRAGFTHSGIHRDDMRLTSEQRVAGEVLSRGQSKRFCLALILGALMLVARHSNKQIILLVDDLHSELDEGAQRLVYQQLDQLDLQLFITNIGSAVPAPLQAKEFKMFHVEHGTINPRNFS
jgi:DNA replication and repair protein RecF